MSSSFKMFEEALDSLREDNDRLRNYTNSLEKLIEDFIKQYNNSIEKKNK